MLFENQAGTTTKPPKFMTLEDKFTDFKWRFKNFILLTDSPLMGCFETSPHAPITNTATRPEPKPVDAYNEDDRKMLEEDKRAFITLIVCLSNEIIETLREHTTARRLWEGLIEKIEGNAEIRDSKRATLKEEFNMFYR